ncbi:MAG TPA: hypothetical protein V6D14_17955 [Coleofasciculaceae cyanobacterium]
MVWRFLCITLYGERGEGIKDNRTQTQVRAKPLTGIFYLYTFSGVAFDPKLLPISLARLSDPYLPTLWIRDPLDEE